MRNIARLLITYFTCRPLTRWLTGIGLFGLGTQTVVIWKFPYTGGAWGAAVVVISWSLLFLGALHMPTIIATLNRSHCAEILPGARRAMFWSALVTVALISLPIPLISVLIEVRTWHSLAHPRPAMSMLQFPAYFWMYWGPTLFLTSWLYVALWFIVSKRSMAGVMSALCVLVLAVFIPTRLIVTRDAALLGPTLLCLATWLLFAAYFFLLPRFALKWPNTAPTAARYRPGREVDLILGTAAPQSILIPVVVAVLFSTTLGKYSVSAWLMLMTVFSTVSGAIAASAASRSRSIWLRTRWSRAELFAQAERSFWRHNGVILVMLAVLLVVVTWQDRLPPELLTRGIPLIALGMALSTYLGLMQTQSLRIPDAALAVVVMLGLMVLAVFAAAGRDLRYLYGIEITLAVLVVALRFTARARWMGLDWRLCRPAGGTAARSAA